MSGPKKFDLDKEAWRNIPTATLRIYMKGRTEDNKPLRRRIYAVLLDRKRNGR